MRKMAAFIFSTLSFLLTTTIVTAQLRSYEISTDAENGSKVLKGLLTRADIQNDTAFKWFNDNMKLGQVNAAAVDAFKKHQQGIQLVVFGGTWCEDTQNLLPVFYRLIDKSNFPDSSITLIGVDRPKTTLYNLHKAFNVTKAPTFIVLKDGKEVGRVEEYGKYGQIDKELGEIVASIQ
ncbi:thioredoxin family protein [Panacibacter ginsenosidivorans]|uniref:Thioredoxin family protein n=1 Tax=Panacibacter ginsenosidivorans TaxID=1813871 RepID=A0A5B8V9T3_9BACT|nr:thioredoxin family protein [Panacibacter ginsenosidivorans]QEC67683.1 thioredoxin family protein [Panacibacter ginsenosidivorans]